MNIVLIYYRLACLLFETLLLLWVLRIHEYDTAVFKVSYNEQFVTLVYHAKIFIRFSNGMFIITVSDTHTEKETREPLYHIVCQKINTYYYFFISTSFHI